MSGLFVFHFLTATIEFALGKNTAAASLTINKSSSVGSVLSGETFSYTIQYSCASLTEDCIGTVITDPLPPELEFVGVFGSAHTTNETYNSGTHTVTFDFIDPLTSGTTGQVTINVRFPNGTTANNTIANNTATISASNASSVSSSASVTAIANNRLTASKYFNGGGLDDYTAYGIEICNNSFYGNVVNGTLNISNITVVDTLPPGATFISALSGGTYDPIENTVTWTVPSVDLGECFWAEYFVELPSSLYNVNDVISTGGLAQYYPVGMTEQTEYVTLSHLIYGPYPEGYVGKNSGWDSVNAGLGGGEYRIEFTNSSNVSIADFYLEDTIPDEIIVTEFRTGGFYHNSGEANMFKTVSYTTNLNNTLTSTPSGTTSLHDNEVVDVSTLGLAANEYITKIRWDFGPDTFRVAAGTYDPIIIDFDVRADATPGDAINCLTGGGSNIANYNIFGSPCDTFEVTAPLTSFRPGTLKQYASATCSGCWVTEVSGDWFSVGDTVQMRLRVRNSSSSASNIDDPSVVDLLPEGLEYVANSWTYDARSTGHSTPVFSYQSNFNSTGRELLKWEWPGTALAPDEFMNVSFEVIITNESTPGENSLVNEYHFLQYSGNFCSHNGGNGGRAIDIYDLDEDGDTAEEFCYGFSSIDILANPSLSSEKLIKGQLDTDWTKYPEIGHTDPGGLSDYKLQIWNSGNVDMTDVVVIDILPFVGDVGVIDPSTRNSRWRPNLIDTVAAPPGVTIYYSIESNPCRDTEGIDPSGPVGCVAPNWSTTPPADITTVQALKFDFGSTVLSANDTLSLEWPMRAPITALGTIGSIPDTIAWSSFGYIAERADNGDPLLPSEPVKVGMTMMPLVPGVIGDFVWEDTDEDGIQDSGETGLNGVRVDLYKDMGDGLTNPASDSLVSFTITLDG
ncbi:MAG: SdrD B-like domain-containing protein, partial [Saprospiraceae bacterium]